MAYSFRERVCLQKIPGKNRAGGQYFCGNTLIPLKLQTNRNNFIHNQGKAV